MAGRWVFELIRISGKFLSFCLLDLTYIMSVIDDFPVFNISPYRVGPRLELTDWLTVNNCCLSSDCLTEWRFYSYSGRTDGESIR